jgi:uncharacterized protein GlcG (DUF336 family)
MTNPMTVALLDAAGRLVAFAGEDGSSLLLERIARGKAHGALSMGVGSRSVPVPGGVLIRDDDEACAIHGIAAAGLRAAPGAADPT